MIGSLGRKTEVPSRTSQEERLPFKGTYELRYIPSGPACHADEFGYMIPMLGKNYYVQEISEGEGITDDERAELKQLAVILLEKNPNRTLRLRIEHNRLFD